MSTEDNTAPTSAEPVHVEMVKLPTPSLEATSHTPTLYPETEKLAQLLLTRAEVNAPHYDDPEGVKAGELEGRYWVGSKVLVCLGVEQPVTWSSLYVDAEVRPLDGAAYFNPFRVQAARNLFGATGAATINPSAICPLLDLKLIQESMEILQRRHKGDNSKDLPSHLLSVSGLARTLGTNVICSFKDNLMELHIIKKCGDVPAKLRQRTMGLLRGMKETADGDLIEVNILEDDPTLHAVITVHNKDLWLDTGIAYDIAKRSEDTYTPPASTLHLTFTVDGRQIVLQMGFEGMIDTFKILEPYLKVVEGASVILEMAFKRAFLGEQPLSEMVKEMIRALIQGDHHDLNNRTQKVELATGAIQMSLSQKIIPLLERLLAEENIPLDEISAALLDLQFLASKIAAVRSITGEMRDIADHFLDLAMSTTEMAKVRTVRLIPLIQKATPVGIIGILGLPEEQEDRVDIKLVTDVQPDAQAIEFAGGLHIILRNLLTNAAEAAASQGLFADLDFATDTETAFRMRVIVTEEEHDFTSYYRITVIDNGRARLSKTRIKALLRPDMTPVTSTTGGSGRAIRIIHSIVRGQSPLAQRRQVFTITNGLPTSVRKELSAKLQEQLEGINGVCVSFLVQKASPASP